MVRATPQDPVRVAVVGTGLAGLATAYLMQTTPLFRPDGTRVPVEVHVFEKSDMLGMDSSSITVGTGDAAFRIDTPMRSINGGSHGRVWKLYSHLRVPVRVADFTYSFSRYQRRQAATVEPLSSSPPPPYSSATPSLGDTFNEPPEQRPRQTPSFIYEGNNGLRWPPLALPSSIQSPFARCTHIIHSLLLAISYLHLLVLAFFYYHTGLTGSQGGGSSVLAFAAACLGIRNVGDEPLSEFCQRHHIWNKMREEVLEPLIAAVTTVGRDEVAVSPVGEALEYIVETFGSSHYVVATGVQHVVALLSAPLPPSHIHLSSTITSMSPSPLSPSSTRLSFSSSSSPPLDFDHVVLATQANQAAVLLRLLRDTQPSASLQKAEQGRIDALGAFEYAKSLVVNHRDVSLLPADPRDRRDLNLASFPTATSVEDDGTKHTLPSSAIQSTHIIARTHPHLGPACELLQTTNPVRNPPSSTPLDKDDAELTHPIQSGDMTTLFRSLLRAEFDYEATQEEELTITEGQLVWVLEDDDSEWYKVKIKSTEANPGIGLVPASYLTAPTPLKVVHALYDYAPARTDDGELENEEELAITEGEQLELWEDEGEWVLVGRKDGKGVGFVPGTYVEEAEEEVASPVAAAYVDPSERVAATKAATKAGDVKTWSVTEMDKKKKKKGTLGVGNGAIFFASESDKNPVQQYPISTLTDLTTEKSKHLHLTFPTSGELHFVISTKEAFDEILAKIDEDRVTSSPPPPSTSSSPPPPAPASAASSPAPAAVRFVAPIPPSTPARPPVAPAAVKAPAGGDGNAVALYDFEGEGDDELNVSEGDRLVFIHGGSDDPDWVKVRKVGSTEEGVVPASYVQVDEGAEDGPGVDPDEAARLAAEAEAEAAASADDAARLQAQLVADAAALERATKLKADRAAKEKQRLKEAAAEDARQRRLSTQPKAAPIPLPTSNDVDEPPQIAARPSRDHARVREAPKGSKPNLNRVRTWKDRTGQFKVDAEYLGLIGNKIRLHKTNGVTIEVPVEKMSGEDKAYINKVMRGESVDHNLVAAGEQPRAPSTSTARSPSAVQASRGTPTKVPHKQTDWFEFFLNAGCAMDDCTRYGNNFEREKMEESILGDLEASNLRTLGLREGDIIRVIRFIKDKYGAPAPPDKTEHEAREAARTSQAQRQPTPPPPNLFTSADGTLKPRRGRPSQGGRSRSTSTVDASALGQAASKLAEQRTSTPPIQRVASPQAMKDPIDKRSSSTIPQMGGFDDDAWTVKGPPSKPPTPAPAPAPVVVSPPPAPPAPTPIQPPSLAPRPESTGPSASTLTYADGLLAGLSARPPSAPVGGGSYNNSPNGSFQSQAPPIQAFNPNAPRGPVAPVPANQGLLQPLIPTQTGFRPQFSQAPLMPSVTGYPGMMAQQSFSAQPSYNGFQAPMGMQPTGMPMGMQPTGAPMGMQPTGSPNFMLQQQQPQQSFIPPQMTGFQQQQPAPSSYNQVPGRFPSPAQPIQFNPMPPPHSQAPPAATATAQFQPNNIFASMKDGSFAKGSSQLGPQEPGKYDALRPQPTGMQFASQGFPGGLQPQQTGFVPQQQPVYPQQTGYNQGFPRQVPKQF
ncbi:hypothetical protein RQP46_006961 [Phenoliferia psychrophenolica]